MKIVSILLTLLMSQSFVACSEQDSTTPAKEYPAVPLEDGAYADMYNTMGTTDAVPIRGRLVNEKAALDPYDTDPEDQISQDEIEDKDMVLVLAGNGKTVDIGTVTTDDEGYVDTSVSLSGKGLGAGEYILEVHVDDQLAGLATVALLDPEHTGTLIRSDVDLTYLNTQFVSTLDKIKLLEEEPKDRKTLPAMEIVYPGLRAGIDGLQNRSLVFLSGSPKFFKRVLEGKMVLDQVVHNGLVLKPYKDITMSNLFGFDYDKIIPDLKEQIGYKLHWLLQLRLEAPATATEVLMGDDSEADIVAYVLYHRFTSGELDASELMSALEDVKVSKSWRDSIAALAPLVTSHLVNNPQTVEAIYINKTGLDTAHFSVEEWSIEGLTRYHQGAWPLALDLYQSGYLSKAYAHGVKARLTDLGQSNATLQVATDHAVLQGYLSEETILEFNE